MDMVLLSQGGSCIHSSADTWVAVNLVDCYVDRGGGSAEEEQQMLPCGNAVLPVICPSW